MKIPYFRLFPTHPTIPLVLLYEYLYEKCITGNHAKDFIGYAGRIG